MNKVHQVINNVLHKSLESNEKLVLIGEDILDPYGGSFKITKGLSTKFQDRVIPTPISEQLIIGFSTGMAMRGFEPVAEIMFGDFMTLTLDQIVNHLTKFYGMYNKKINPNVLIRTPMGGYRGYGPTHSQSLEKFFIGIPNLKVFAISHLGPLKEFYSKLLLQVKGPRLLIENKTLYSQINLEIVNNKIDEFNTTIEWNNDENYLLKMKILDDIPSDFVIVTYGGLVPMVMKVVYDIFIETEINGEIIVLTSLNEFDITSIIDSIVKSGMLIIIEEGFPIATFGDYVISSVIRQKHNILKKEPLHITSKGLVIPSSKEKELSVLPNEKIVFEKIVKFIGR